ncbi:Polyadenylate-binding protein RBP47B (Poly(A)-binding protein RBP47B) (RNA-binding protein 47B) (AtRBP47B) [Durusdinium trenchii]|uniref:Polyadenylate-binding protein RBP47B (Poly(A)-binding protein RBP47B) (RNA-binding protein 47B) (AtRBP47B) n=1 Tax=Durusdinium trenchii TaxID=1381693 RepID=A0ABP0S4R9_9DINO
MSPPDAKIFVRNLPSDIKEKEVKYIFSKYGAVRSADVIMWPGLPSLCPNGSLAPLEISLANRQKIDWQACAFITYSTADAAAVAIRALNGVYRPRSSSPEPLVVMLARPGALPDPVQSGLMPPPAEDQVALLIGADKGGNLSSSTAQMASATASYVAEKTRCKLFVGNLHAEIPRERLSQVFGECGRVVNVHVMTGKSKFGSACAFVEMATPAEAESALKALHQKYEPRIGSMTAPVTVTYFQSQSSGKAAQTLAGPAAGFSSGGFSRYTPYQV